MTKKELRNKYLSARKQLSDNDIDQSSIQIANQLLTLDIWDFRYYHLFLSITKNNEINTEYILQILHGRDKNIIISKSDFKSYEMYHFLLTEDTPIAYNSYGIPEPQDGIPISSRMIQVVFIPLIYFDANGHRVGYGKGFYDRFLANCNDSCIKIGLGLFEPNETISDTHSMDIILDYAVSPNKIHLF